MGYENKAQPGHAGGNYSPQPVGSGGVSKGLAFAILLLQVALLVLGFMIYSVVKSAVATQQETADSPVTGEASNEPGDSKKPGVPSSSRKSDDLPDGEKPARNASSAKSINDLRKEVSALKDQVNKDKSATEVKLDTMTRTLEEVKSALTKEDGVIDEIGKIKTVNNEFANQTSLLQSSFKSLAQLLTNDEKWKVAESDVIVIAADTGNLPIRSYLSAYRKAFGTNPWRVGFKKHRMGLWTVQGSVLKDQLALSNEVLTIDLEKTWKDLEGSKPGDLVADPTGLAQSDLIRKLRASPRLPLTRFVLVLPADTPAPKGDGLTAWGDAKVDVLLIEHPKLGTTDYSSWLNFCSGRGLLSVLRAPSGPPESAAPSGASPDKKKEEAAKSSATGPTQRPSPSPAASGPPKADPQIEDLARQLARELIRLTQPSPPSG
jgi:hypothetical protein